MRNLKLFAQLMFVFLSLSAFACNKPNIVIELKPESIKVDDKYIELKKFYNSPFYCETGVVILIDRNVKHQKVIGVMDKLKESGCNKISIAAT